MFVTVAVTAVVTFFVIVFFEEGFPSLSKSSFDVTMGSYDGAEVCEFVGLFILNGLSNEYGKESIGLYRDDGLAIFKNI